MRTTLVSAKGVNYTVWGIEIAHASSMSRIASASSTENVSRILVPVVLRAPLVLQVWVVLRVPLVLQVLVVLRVKERELTYLLFLCIVRVCMLVDVYAVAGLW